LLEGDIFQRHAKDGSGRGAVNVLPLAERVE
jgi:hypothetical protein